MGRLISSVGATLLLALALPTVAAAQGNIVIENQDCRAVLESYAVNPKSVPKEVADACQQLLNIAPGAGTASALGEGGDAAEDPCAGPNAADSVYCWGPWAALAPAAGGAAPPALASDLYEYPPRPEDASLFDKGGEEIIDPPPPLDLPLGSCAVGLPCGYATVVDGRGAVGDPEETEFARFELADDGSSFSVIPVEAPRIDSVTGMTVQFTDRPSDDYEQMRAQGRNGQQGSQLVARALRDADGNIVRAADDWGDADLVEGTFQSGKFAWGRTISQADLDTLNNDGSARSLSFSGVMNVDSATVANITMQFGATPVWNGSWENPAYSFTAGGGVHGADFVSAPEQFSENVQGGFVQGVLQGTLGDNSIAHIIEVSLDEVGLVRDVGLLIEDAN